MGRQHGYRCSRWLPDHVTAVSHATAEAHLVAGMVEADHLSVLGNGIEVDAWRPDAQVRAIMRRELGLAGEFLWIAVGRLEPVKDYPAMLQALAGQPETARLLVLGAGPLKTDLVQLAARLGLERRVRFQGFEPNVKRWIQAADGFVLSSRYEGLPMVMLEAGACGLPAVATDVPGTREVIADGKNGWLAPAGDPQALAAAMARLMRAPIEERRAMGERARQRVAVRFSLDNVLDRWERLYEELLLGKRAARRTRPAVRESLSRQSAASA
jgi:glycosyltransferase involved in cell wall biosynthesis